LEGFCRDINSERGNNEKLELAKLLHFKNTTKKASLDYYGPSNNTLLAKSEEIYDEEWRVGLEQQVVHKALEEEGFQGQIVLVVIVVTPEGWTCKVVRE